MPYKVKCKHVGFMGDPKRFPCHFGYRVGDEIIYDGERFEGRICPGILTHLAQVVSVAVYTGFSHYSRVLFRYSGLSARDPGMKEHDGVGWRPLKSPPEGVDPKLLGQISYDQPVKLGKGMRFSCLDIKTLSTFEVELIGLSDKGQAIPYYRREMSILEKIKAEPGLTAEQVLDKFSKWEKEEIYPPLHPLNVRLMLDELAEVGYIELQGEKAYPKNRLSPL